MQRYYRFWWLLIFFLTLLLNACSDDPTVGGIRPTLSANATSTVKNTLPVARNSVPTIALPTPTYSPLPIMPTPIPTALPLAALGGKLSGAVSQDAQTLHPYKANNKIGMDMVSLLFAASLVRRDPITLQPMVGAAEKWTIDGTTVVFSLKNSLKWSDGTPLTSADYVWTYEQARNSKNAWPLAAVTFYDAANPASTGIESYEAVDPTTLKIKLHTFSFDLVYRAAAIEPLPKHIWQKLDWNNNVQATKPSVTSGPWKLKEWKTGNALIFEPNPNSSVYDKPRLEALTFYVLPDNQVALQKLKIGEIDFYNEPLVSDYTMANSFANVQSYNWGAARPTWYYVGFNFRRPDFQDKYLRQALAWAIDRDAIVQKQGGANGQLLNSSVSPSQPSFYPNTARYDFNPDKAHEILQAGGYTLTYGRLADKTGRILPPLTLIYNTPSPLYEGIAASLKANFAALGLQLTLRDYDVRAYNKLLITPDADFDMFLSGWTADYTPENFGDVWRAIPELNSGAYQDAKLIELYSKAVGEADINRRKEYLAQIQAIEAEELPYLFLYAERGRLLANKRVAGFTTGLLGPEKNLYVDWYVVQQS